MHKKIDDENPRVLSANTLLGTNVKNTEGEDIGEIMELMIDLNYGNIAYAVLQFGGIMGLGDKYFAIPWSALKVDTGDEHFVLDIDKEKLEDAEGFEKDEYKKGKKILLKKVEKFNPTWLA